MQSSRTVVVIRPASSLADFLFTRKLRNQICQFLTGTVKRVGLLQQLHFYLHRPPGIELFIAERQGMRAGYLLIRHDGPLVFVTEAVWPSHRRQGVACAMLKFATQRWPHLTAEILTSNRASLDLHASMGFKTIAQTDRLVTMRLGSS